ncbi:Alpha/Beta hydrolase protein [Colletotrichum lupini]|nr:Alpha/Beta hydrolase protein [Colletotrichum lupini]
MTSSKDYVFKQVGNTLIEATAYWKPTKSKEPKGLALALHGGGFVIGSRHALPEVEVGYLADANFVVVSADYRLCPQVPLHDVIEDAIDVFSWCKTELPQKFEADTGFRIDARKAVVFGQSAGALLALHLGALAEPPRAILDFYGVKYVSDEFWHKPLPALAAIPTLPQALTDKIFEEPVMTTTVTSLEKAAASQDGERKGGMPAPDLSVPRNAWLFAALKNGTQMKSIVKDDDFDRVDPVKVFHPKFPPTFFVHGDNDGLIPNAFSERACRELTELGVKARISLIPGQSHGFDAGLGVDDPEWPQVRDALDFLIFYGNKAI